MSVKQPFIIADVGANHRGKLDLAESHITLAREAGCDAVKFQLYTHRELYGVPGHMPFEMPEAWLPKLRDHAERVGIEFMCTAFSPEGVELVDPYVKRHKLASSEMRHVGMWQAMGDTKKPVIISTGGAHFTEIMDVQSWFREFRPETQLSILECVAKYPAQIGLYDLSMVSGGTVQGISDHTIGNALSLAALGAGATIFEKHFDAKPGLGETPDTPVSASFAELVFYVSELRDAASAFGNGVKQPRHQPEMALRWRRRLIATRAMAVGDTLVYGENYGIYRSLKDDTHGGPPGMAPQLHGKKLSRAKEPGDSLFLDDIGTGDTSHAIQEQCASTVHVGETSGDRPQMD